MVITTARRPAARACVQFVGGAQQGGGHRASPSVPSVRRRSPVGEYPEEVLGELRLEQAVGERAVGGRAGHRQIAGDGLRGVLAQLGDVRGDRARVPARDGAGEGRVAGAQGVVEGGAEQRAEHPVGGLDARPRAAAPWTGRPG